VGPPGWLAEQAKAPQGESAAVCFLLRHPNFACFASERIVFAEAQRTVPVGCSASEGLQVVVSDLLLYDGKPTLL